MRAHGDRRGGASRVALRWTHAVVIALVAALAVLVHHDTAPTVRHVPPSGAVRAAGMTHDRLPASAHPPGHAATSRAAAPMAAGDDGACSVMAGQHCSTASFDTVKTTPPARTVVDCVPPPDRPTAAGRNVPGTGGRAPPDLSLLSRLLV